MITIIFDKRETTLKNKTFLWFTVTFAILVALFFAHLCLLAFNSDFSVVTDLRGAKDLSTALGLFSAIFSGFAAFGLLLTINLQGHAIEIQNTEVKQASALQVRLLHFELLRLSIEDEELEKVWSGSDANLSGKQSMYVNLILSHWSTMFSNELMNEEELRNLLPERMHTLMLQFWKRNRVSRLEHAKSSEPKSLQFHNIVEEYYQRAL
ncbi:MAG: DUF6082 family protein [Alphaproteobacteria bacterium]